MAPTLLTTREVAERLRTPVSTIRYWRHAGVGPPGIKIGRRVLYDAADLDAWIESRFAEQADGAS
jgi:excisionase family DNA binding protein